MKIYILGSEQLKLSSETNYIEPVNPNSHLVTYYLGTTPDTEITRTEAAVFATHLKCYRQILDTRNPTRMKAVSEDGLAIEIEVQKDEMFLISEDDVLLTNDFLEKTVPEILSNLRAGTPIVSLCYTVESWDGFWWAGLNPEKKNLSGFRSTAVEGTFCYLISLDWISEVLRRFDRPWDRLDPELHTVECVLRMSGGLLAFPSLEHSDSSEEIED